MKSSNTIIVSSKYIEEKEHQIADLSKKVHILNEANMKLENELGQFAEASKTIERLQEQKQKVIALIKDGRFVEALQELENETLA